MSEEEIKALLAEAQTQILDTVNKTVSGAIARTQSETDKKFAEFMASMPKPSEADAPDAPAESSLELKSLQQKLADLEAARANDLASAQSTQRDNAILSELGSRKLVAPTSLKRLLVSQYGHQLEQENGQWFVRDGDQAQPLAAVVDKFLASDDGKIFTPPNSQVNGNGSKPGNVQNQPEKPKDFAALIEQSLQTRG